MSLVLAPFKHTIFPLFNLLSIFQRSFNTVPNSAAFTLHINNFRIAESQFPNSSRNWLHISTFYSHIPSCLCSLTFALLCLEWHINQSSWSSCHGTAMHYRRALNLRNLFSIQSAAGRCLPSMSHHSTSLRANLSINLLQGSSFMRSSRTLLSTRKSTLSITVTLEIFLSKISDVWSKSMLLYFAIVLLF